REHRRSRRGRPSHGYGNPAAAAVQPPALHAQSLEEYGLLGPGHVRGLLPPAVGLDSRVRGVRRGGVALRGLPLVKLVAFFARAVLDDRARHLLADPRLRRARAGAARQVSAAAVSRRRRPGPLPAAPAGRLVGRTAAHSAAAAGARERRYRARRPRLATPAAG